MMADSSLETTDPPAQDEAAPHPRQVIQTWGFDYGMRLEDTGDGCAVIVRLVNRKPTEMGTVGFVKTRNLHVITWNPAGRLAFERSQRDSWDDRFYYAMAEWQRRTTT